MKLIVANWKLNPQTYREAELLAAAEARAAGKFPNVKVVICPPFIYLEKLTGELKANLGAQDVFWGKQGAFTGEISPLMLKNSEVEYVIVGHSERRMHLGETDEMINKKVLAALHAGLTPILCVGEPLSVRRKGLAAAQRFIANQLRKDLKRAINQKPKAKSLIVAYEPVWAISTSGTGLIDAPEDAAVMAKFIARRVGRGVRVLYGGSVDAANVRGFLGQKGISGALVGGVSLHAKEFSTIIEIASSL